MRKSTDNVMQNIYPLKFRVHLIFANVLEIAKNKWTPKSIGLQYPP